VQPTSGLSEAEIGSFIAESEASRQVTSPRRMGLTCPTAPTRSLPHRAHLQEFATSWTQTPSGGWRRLWSSASARSKLFVGDVARASAALSKLETEAHLLFVALQGGSMSEPEPSPENS